MSADAKAKRSIARMKIPAVNLKAQVEPLRAELLAAFARIIDSQQFVLGAEVQALEEEVAQYSNAKLCDWLCLRIRCSVTRADGAGHQERR